MLCLSPPGSYSPPSPLRGNHNHKCDIRYRHTKHMGLQTIYNITVPIFKFINIPLFYTYAVI